MKIKIDMQFRTLQQEQRVFDYLKKNNYNYQIIQKKDWERNNSIEVEIGESVYDCFDTNRAMFYRITEKFDNSRFNESGFDGNHFHTKATKGGFIKEYEDGQIEIIEKKIP